VGLAAGALLLASAGRPTLQGADGWGVLVLAVAMMIAERLAVPLPRSGAVSVATIPHIVAVLLLPAWLSITSAGAAMLVDQLVGRAGPRKTIFNISSVMLTLSLSALVADWAGLHRDTLGRSDQWQQVPAFLLVAAVYY